MHDSEGGEKDAGAMELRDLAPDRQVPRLVELPVIDTSSVRRTNMGGSHSMPPSPTSGLISAQPVEMARHPSVPHAGDLAVARAPRASFVQSGKMTKVPHYGRIRSVTARVLRMMDPRALTQQQQQQQQQQPDDNANSGSAQVDEGSYGGTAAGLLGQSVVDQMREAGRRRRRRFSHGSIPAVLSRVGSRESRMTHSNLRLRMSLDQARPSGSQISRQSSRVSEQQRLGLGDLGSELSAVQSVQSAAAQNAGEAAIAIPMPGFFLDPASDDWIGGHSFRQRMRYPEEAITVPASLTKRVHYEVSYDYPKNAISTARYNVVTFLPAQLAAQFSKVANIYFLFVAALQQVPGWSTTGRWTTILPLSVFVSLSIAHEGYDDFRRHRMDHAENSQRTRVLKVKVHDRERLSFNFREMRHRGSQSIHSFRMRSSQSIHDIGRNTIDGAKRWIVSAVSIGSTVRGSIVKRLAEKRRKKRELEDSDDEDEQPIGVATGDGDGAESLLRRQITRGVMSLRGWRPGKPEPGEASESDLAKAGDEASPWSTSRRASEVPSASDMPSLAMSRAHMQHRRQASRLGGASLAPSEQPRRGPMVAFNDVVEEMSFAGEEPENPLPENMSCRWKKKRWENVQVGDMLMICKDDWIPADCVVIASTGFDGTCFVETAALDGETTLKQKQALEATNGEIQTAEQLAAFNAFTYVEPPSAELYNFEGYMEVNGERLPLTPNQLLLRGSVLRNTAYIYAQVVYAGEQTRLRLNATRNVRTKAPQIQRITNRIVVLVFMLLLVLCFVFAGLGIHWNDYSRHGHWYLDRVTMPATALIFGYIVMMNALIPISLYVTLEAVKIFQCWFIQQDVEMYHAPSDTRAETRTTAINEDLGMVQYVFSDKTGTLTENIMKLRAVMIAGFSYLHMDLDRLQGSKAAPLDPEETASPTTDDNDQRHRGHQRSSSRLSFLRSGPNSPGNGLPSPSLFKAQLFAKHRRQHSLPSSPIPSPPGQQQQQDGSRALQQLAAANRTTTSSTCSRHSRGVSASVLRSPPVHNHSGLQNEVLPESSGPEIEPLLEEERRAEASIAQSAGPENDPDLIGEGEPGDPRMHTPAGEDVPQSDLLRLPSSRRIMDSQAPPTDVFRARAEWFLRCMALCHTVQPDRDPLTGRITGYQATSPDEKALVAAAAELGYVMNNRAGPLVQLRVVASERMRDFNRAVLHEIKSTKSSPTQPPASTPTTAVADPAPFTAGGESATTAVEDESEGGQPGTGADAEAQSFDRGVPAPHPTDRLGSYEVLDVLEFSSARKRMSVILRCPDGRIVMMSKGADSAIWPRLCAPSRLKSEPGNMAHMPRPSPPTEKFGTPLRRKLSHPSAAYLHSRSASVTSSCHNSHSNLESLRGITPDGLAFPPRAVARLGDGTMYFGELAGGRRVSAAAVSDEDGADEAQPLSAPVNTSFAAMRRPPQHRRLMSDSQFSAVSDASSFADTQGQEEIPLSFEDPTAQEEEWARARALEALHQFSTEGLRTLVYAHKEVSPAFYGPWHVRFVAASTALNNRQQQVEALCEEIESDLLLSGVSAIEDRLQEGVPETIFKLRRAGIRVWMLTGDKVETAINIAKSCRLIETDTVEITELGARALGQQDKMRLLVMQSLTNPEELGRTVSQALAAARSLTSVDQRFEERSRVDKLRRGMKKFGNMIDVRRLARRRRQPAADGPPDEVLSAQSTGWQQSTKTAGYLDIPITDNGGRAGTEVGWADSVRSTAVPLSPYGDTEDGMADRAVSQATSETAAQQQQQQQRRLLSPSSSSESTRPSEGTRSAPKSQGTDTQVNSAPSSSSSGGSLAVVVDGETLAALEQTPEVLEQFLSLGTLCDAVICSRVSPSQKALIVHNMRVRCEGGEQKKAAARRSTWLRPWRPLMNLFTHDSNRYKVTLAIGDGGNDIAMIQEAHVGIGIAGQEGLQASRAADFSIGQFRFLQRLLLVHGRWSYVRVSMFIMGTFYKCMAFYVTQLIFQFYTGFSGTSLFENWTLSMYNTLFSILPVLVVGIFEQDLRPETLLAYPELYRDMGPRNHLFTVPEFIRRVVVIGVVHAVVAAYFPFAANLLMGYDGTTNDQFIMGVMVYSIMVLIVTLKIAYIDVRRWVLFSHISVAMSLALWFGWNGVLNHIYPKSPGEGYYVLGIFRMLLDQATFWFQWIIFVA
ncbi:hypothetical protein GGF46_002017, partial [Coemansia sp. RSA 552]